MEGDSSRRRLAGFLSAATLSRTALEMVPTALVVATAVRHASPAHAARLLALYTAVNALAGPAVGGQLDRRAAPVRLYRAALGVAAGSTALLGWAGGHGWASVVAVATLGVSGAALSGAWSGALGRIAESTHRSHAWDVATYCVASTAGPLLASGLVLAGPAIPFEAAGALAVAALGLSVLLGSVRSAKAGCAQRAGIVVSLRYLCRTRRIRTVVLFTLLIQAEAAAVVLSAPSLSQRMTGTVGLAGLLVGGLAVGALLASLIYGVAPAVAGLPDWTWAVLFGLCGVALAWAPTIGTALPLLLLMGCCNGALLTTQFALAGREAPDAARSQVFALSGSLRIGALSLGTLVLGLPAVGTDHARLLLGGGPLLGVALLLRNGSSDGTRVASVEPEVLGFEHSRTAEREQMSDFLLAVAEQSIEGVADLDELVKGVATVRVGASSDLAKLADGADALVVTLQPLPAARIASLPASVRVIGRAGVGLDTIDLDAARERGIAVVHEPTYAVNEVATHAAALLLAAHRRLLDAHRRTREGWALVSELGAIPDLSSATLGLVGYGNIGRAVATRMRPFVRRIAVFDPYLAAAPVDAEVAVSLEELLAAADLVSLHVPLTETTRGLISGDALAAMKPGAVLVNVSRGGLVDERALVDSLRSGQLGAAGLDVFETEPLPPDSPLRSAPRLILTPHIAWYSEAASERMARWTVEDVLAYLGGAEIPHGRLAVPGAARLSV